MERRASERVVADYVRALRMDQLLSLAESADRACPICGTDLAMAEGPKEPYWRCPNNDCDYTRNIGQPAPRDGLIICANAGSRQAGEVRILGRRAPRWRCTVNHRHRQRIAKSHLKLPKMRALVPANELRKLDKRFGFESSQGSTAEPVVTRRPNGSATPRELDVLRLMAAHRSGTEIAAELGLSKQTVKTYIRDLYRKLGVNGRQDALRAARKKGWL